MEEGQKKIDTDSEQLSHELRNLLGEIYNAAQLLELSLTKKEMDKERDIAREIVRSVEKMEKVLKENFDSAWSGQS
jgi:nitrogen-specific signal transduction histidine kinase